MPSQLVAYSGFSATNYIQEPYSPDLDFGTGEWSVGSWVNIPTSVPLATFPKGPEMVTNGTFDSNITGWSNQAGDVTWSSGRIAVGRATSGYALANQNIPTVVGRTYYFKGFVDKAASVGVPYMSPINATDYFLVGSSGFIEFAFTATQTTTSLTLGVGATAGDIVYFDDITVKEMIPTVAVDRSAVAGPSVSMGVTYTGKIVATVSDGTTTRTVITTAAYNTATWLKATANYVAGKLSINVNGVDVASVNGAPLLSLNSRYNLVPDSETFENWSKQGTNTVTGINSVVAPDGTMTADIANLTVGQGKIFTGAVGAVIGKPHVFSIYMKGTAGQTLTVGDDGTGADAPKTLTGGWDRFFITGNQTQTLPNLTFYLQAGQTATTFAVWGAQYEVGSTPTTYQRTGIRLNLTSDFAFQAPLTIGNSFALNAPFPGSITMVKLGATVPTPEQSVWMYEQEKQMFRSDAQITLPATTAVLDLAYDESQDKWTALQAGFDSSFTGLVRTGVTTPKAGTFSKLATQSGVELVARAGVLPGVDVVIPAYGLREELVRRAEAAAKASKTLTVFDFDAIGFTATTTNGSNQLTAVTGVSGVPFIGMGVSGTNIPAGTTIIGINGTTYTISANATGAATVTVGQSEFTLPAGWSATEVLSAGNSKREGSTKDFVRRFDGFRETIRFAVAPGASAWVQITGKKE
jgi:hypothetical protein